MAREQFLPQQDRRTRRVRRQAWFTFVLGRSLDQAAPLFAKRFHYEGWGSLTVTRVLGTDVFALEYFDRAIDPISALCIGLRGAGL